MSIYLFESEKNNEASHGHSQAGWHQRHVWDDNQISDITDTMGASASRMITSYPTPTARLEFTRDAFIYCTEHPNAKNTKWFEGLSHCLDVWEILFYFDFFKGEISFREWSINDVRLLEQSSRASHHELAKILSLYFNEEDGLDKVYLFYYLRREGGDTYRVPFAGSSPYTGFFTTPRVLPNGLGIPEKNGTYFGVGVSNVRGLEERSPDFQKYFVRAVTAGNFPLIQHYINAVLPNSSNIGARGLIDSYFFRLCSSHK